LCVLVVPVLAAAELGVLAPVMVDGEAHGERFVPDAFVDLVVDEDIVANGGSRQGLVTSVRCSRQDAETAINLNTAERDELLKLPGVDEASATKLLDSRRSAGLFLDLSDFATRAQLSADTANKLAAMMRAMENAGVYPRE
jgi:DNA uptake protein ComE-like DNA-binding protein